MRMTLTSAAILSALAFPPLIQAAPTAPVRQGSKAIDPAENGIGRWIPDVEFISLKGKRGRLSDFKFGKALVVAFTGASCPVSKSFAPTLSALEKAYSKQGVSFLFVDPIAVKGAPKDLAKLVRNDGFAGPAVVDVKESLALGLGIRNPYGA